MAIAGCASLPDFDALRAARYEDNRVRVMNARGQVTLHTTGRLASRLTGNGRSELLQRHLGFMESLDGPPLIAGNDTRLLIDGPAAYGAMFRAISQARDHVNLETYIFDDDAVGHQLADLLIRKQAEGVQVNLIHDAVGTLRTPAEFFQRMAGAGIQIVKFNPVNPFSRRGWQINNRDHRKIVVVDGRLAFTGGINFSDVYSSGSSRIAREPTTEEGWRDTQIEIRGPAVAQFQRLFLETWQKQRGPPLAKRDYLPRLDRQGDKLVRVIASEANERINHLYLEILSAITHAEETIHITMAYFVPDRQTIDALCDAARRGVDVKLVLPGFSDFPAVFHAGRSHYSTLLAAGVKIYERRDAMLHAKTAVIDGVWSSVGSANMDMRSFLHNNEVNAVILGTSFAIEMETMFRADLQRATAVDAQTWSSRSLILRLREQLARIWEYWL